MRILYSLPHPADRLGTHGAGHLVRAAALLDALSALGHEIVRMEAATAAGSGVSVRAYRNVVKRVLPRLIAMMLRDWGRRQYGKDYAMRLVDAVTQHRPD